MSERNLSSPISDSKPNSAGLVASLGDNQLKVELNEIHVEPPPNIPLVGLPASPTLQQPSPTPSIRSSRSRKKLNPIEVIVPSAPKDLTAQSEWPLINLATRLDRLEAFVDPKEPSVQGPNYWNDIPIPHGALRNLLFTGPHFRLDDLEALVMELSEHYKQVDKNWITKVCHMLAQAKTSQLQIVSIARTLQNLLNAPAASIAYLENLSKCPWVEKSNSDFEVKLRLVDIDEKTAIILEHERLILHVAELAEKLSLITPPDNLIANLLRMENSAPADDGNPPSLAMTAARIEKLEARAEEITKETMILEKKILQVVSTIQAANAIHASIRRASFIKASRT